MGLVLKIILIVSIVIVFVLGAIGYYGYHTYKQVKNVLVVSQNETFVKDLTELAKGNCTKLPSVEPTMKDMGVKMKGLCGNLIVKVAIARGWTPAKFDVKALCAEVNKPVNPIENAISTIKAACANNTTMQNKTLIQNKTINATK
jgi:hypothetical protein